MPTFRCTGLITGLSTTTIILYIYGRLSLTRCGFPIFSLWTRKGPICIKLWMKVSITNLQTFKSSDRQLRIKQGGNVYVSLRLALILSCQMDFKYYPFDWQLCPLEMSSFGYRKDEIVFEFETLEEIDNLKAVRVNSGINLPRKCVSSIEPKFKLAQQLIKYWHFTKS